MAKGKMPAFMMKGKKGAPADAPAPDMKKGKGKAPMPAFKKGGKVGKGC